MHDVHSGTIIPEILQFEAQKGKTNVLPLISIILRTFSYTGISLLLLIRLLSGSLCLRLHAGQLILHPRAEGTLSCRCLKIGTQSLDLKDIDTAYLCLYRLLHRNLLKIFSSHINDII